MTEHLLLLSPFFHPEPIGTGKYNSFLVKALVRKGVRVDVICFHPLYPDWRPRLSHSGFSGVRISRGGAGIRYPKSSLLRRVALECGYLFHVLRHANRFKHYSQIVAVLPPMLFLPLVRMAAGPKVRVTAIAHDLQGIMAGVGRRKKLGPVVHLVRFLEATVFRCCHGVIAISKGMAYFLSESYNIPSSKVSVCWPFVTINTQNSESRLGHLFVKDKKHVAYAGALGEKQNPEDLTSFFLDLVNRRNDVVCHIFSGGPIFETLKRNWRTRVDRLVFHDLVAEHDLFELYLRSHVQVIPEKIGFSEGAVPSKLPNLMASGVPILYIGQKNSDVWHIIQRADAGLCADSWDLDALSVLVDQLLMESNVGSYENRRQAFGKNLAALFNVEILIKKILNHQPICSGLLFLCGLLMSRSG